MREPAVAASAARPSELIADNRIVAKYMWDQRRGKLLIYWMVRCRYRSPTGAGARLGRAIRKAFRSRQGRCRPSTRIPRYDRHHIEIVGQWGLREFGSGVEVVSEPGFYELIPGTDVGGTSPLPCGHSQVIRVPCGSVRVIVNLA
jgi:hypothetical protein